MITLYELKGRDDRRYSLFSWRARMALAHKGLAFDTHPVLLSDKPAIAFSGGRTVPVVRDGDTVVRDSWKIAEYLEQRYAERASLFGGAIGRGLSQTLNLWADRVLVPAMMQAIVADIHERVDPADSEYFRSTMEGALKAKIEEMGAGRDKAAERLQRTLEPLRATLKRQPFFCGAASAYGDIIVFSAFQWARIMCPRELLAADDPLAAWRGRMLELNGGFARDTPIA